MNMITLHKDAAHQPAKSDASLTKCPPGVSSPHTPVGCWGWWSVVEASAPRLRLVLSPHRRGCVSRVAPAASACLQSLCGSGRLADNQGTATRASPMSSVKSVSRQTGQEILTYWGIFGTRGSIVGSGTMLQAGRSGVRLIVTSLLFFFFFNLSADRSGRAV
jgi:hypothetical protein